MHICIRVCDVPGLAHLYPSASFMVTFACRSYVRLGCFPVQAVSKLGMLVYGSALSTRLIHYGALPFVATYCQHLRTAAFSVDGAAVAVAQKNGLEVLEFTRTRWRLHDALFVVAKASLLSLTVRFSQFSAMKNTSFHFPNLGILSSWLFTN